MCWLTHKPIYKHLGCRKIPELGYCYFFCKINNKENFFANGATRFAHLERVRMDAVTLTNTDENVH